MIQRFGGRLFWAVGGVLLLAALVTISATCATATAAQGEAPNYTGVDVVFVVDQSGSMGGQRYGSEYHPQANDPNDLRFSGLQQMVERLAGYRLNYFHDSEVQFQIGVVYFGSNTEMIVAPTTVAPDTFDEWRTLSDELGPFLAADAFRRNLKSTDHLLALQESKRILQEMEGNWSSGQHIQAIMMLTDGEWAVTCPEAGRAAPPYCKNGEFQSYSYRQMLTAYVRDELPYPRYRFFLAAINDRSDQYWSRVQGYWQELTHNNAELVVANTMWALFERILADLTVNEPGLADKKMTSGTVVEIDKTQDLIVVPPYLQEIVFSIHKPSPEVRVKMYQDGAPVEDLMTTTVEGADQYIERISLRNPEPGYIQIERPVTTAILRIFMSQIGADVSCEPLSVVPQFIPVRLQCTLSSRNGPLPPYSDPRYQLAVEAEIHGTGDSQRLALAPQGQGVYTMYYLPAQAGEFALSITATTQKPDGSPFELFRKPPTGMASFTVEPTQAQLDLNQSPTVLLNIPMTVNLVDSQGRPLPAPPESAAFVQMHLALNGAEEQILADLVPGDSGYEGEARCMYAGDYSLRLTGLVTDPSTGQASLAFDHDLGKLQVSPPQIVWQGFESPQPQYQPAVVDFYLADQATSPLGDVLEVDWSLESRLEVKHEGQTMPLALAVKTRGHWIGDAVFEKNGDYVLLASAWAKNRAGDEVVLLDKEIVMPFTVRPMMLVRVNIVQPEMQSEYAWRDILWRRRRIAIEVAIQDEAGAPLAPEAFLQEPAGAPISVEMVSPQGESSGPLTLARGNAPGCYLASYERYEPFQWYAHRDLGWYDVRVQPGGALQGTYVYEKPGGVTARVHLKRHTLWWLLPTILGIVFAALLAVAVRRAYLHLWSAEGTLSVETEGIAFPWRRQLRDSGRHTLTFSQRDGLPPVFRRIVVRQRRGSGHQPIEATVQLKKGVKMPLRLVDGARKPLGEGIFVAYERGAGVAASSQVSLSLAVWANGLWALLMLAGLGGVVFSFVASLS